MSARASAAALAGAALLLASPAHADDQSDGVAAGTMRLDPAAAAAATSARVTLDGTAAEVSLLLVLKAAGTFHLDLPRFGWLGEAETYPDRNFPELKVIVDGRPAAPADTFAAWARGRDVTAAIRAAGLDPYAVAATPPVVGAPAGGPAALDGLVAAGIVTYAPEGLLAEWTVARRLATPLAAGRHVVSLRYTARPAFALVTPSERAASVRWADYCLTPAAATALLARQGLAGPVIMRRYVIPVSLGGIAPAMISVRVARSGGGMTLLCGAGGRAAVDPTGDVAVRAGDDGAVHVLRVARPG